MSVFNMLQLVALASGLGAAGMAMHVGKRRGDWLSLGMLSAGAVLVALPPG